jgi:hypothetical protein
MMSATNIHYERANRVRGLSSGGIGAMFMVAQYVDLIGEIDRSCICSNGTCPITSRIMS